MPSIKKAIENPTEILPYIRRVFLRQIFISKVEQNGQSYFKYKGKLYPTYLGNKAASPFIFPTAHNYCKGNGIDIGGGNNPFPGAYLIENEPDQNAFRLDRFADESLDYVFSSHCLEHLDPWQDALDLWISKIKVEGHLFLYLPHQSMELWKPNGLWVGSEHKWSPSIDVLIPYLEERDMEILEYNPSKDDYWSFHIAARKIS